MTEAELQEYLNTPSPYDQTETRSALENGWYDLTVRSLTAQFDKNGLLLVKGEYDVLAPESAKGRRQFENHYIGTHADPKALLPETRKKAIGDRMLVMIAKSTNTPVTNTTPAAFHASLIGKAFTARIEAKDQYVNLTRAVALGSVPARIDGTAPQAGNGNGAIMTPGQPIAGATFGGE